VTIDLPINNAVFQRNSIGQATIYIAGTYQNTVVTSIQVRLVTPGTSTSVVGFDWTIINSAPTKGSYFGQLNNVPAGWYTLEIRTINTGVILSNSSVSRVGIGDVYLMAGQSNAAGLPTSEVTVPTDFTEKNITQNLQQGCNASYPSFATLSPISTTSKVSITGESSWAYGRLGKLLTDSLSIPVAFYNGAISGTSIENWVASANGSATEGVFPPYSGGQYCYSVGAPYNIFNKALKYYPYLFGIRAIIWHQGETDNVINTSTASYTNQLNTLIAKIRSDFGSTIPWMVSRASYYESTDAAIIIGQDNVLNAGNQIFPGPNTDTYLSPGDRVDNTHFNTAGLIKFASGLYNYIVNTSFLTSSVPIAAKAQPNLSVTVAGLNVTLTAPSGYNTYKWVSGNDINGTALSTVSVYVASTGTYRCYMTDANANVIFSQAVNVDLIKSQQTISTIFNDSLFLSSYTPYSIVNSNGPISIDQSIGGVLDGDGIGMSINGITYAKGIGTNSGSEIVFKLPTGFHSRFKASIGIDDEITNNASVVFKLYGNTSTLLYTSPTMTHLSNAVNINVDIKGNYSTLRLVVENAGGVALSNHANWANARITYSKPKNLTITKQSTFCLGLAWAAENDQNGIISYKLYKNDIVQATLPAGTLNYTFTGLNRNTSHKLSIMAIDANGFESSKIDTTVSTLASTISYSSNNQVCIGDSIIPTIMPGGGFFKLVNKPDSVNFTFNSTTGAVKFTTDGFVQMRHIMESGTTCADSNTYYVGAIDKYAAPSITASINLMNIGDSVILNSTACISPSTLLWHNNTLNSNLKIKPSDTLTVFARCKNSTCLSDSSNRITINVIPNCPNKFTLSSTVSDLNYGSKSFNFKASQSIEASNKIFNPTGAIFKAVQKIELKPGFSVEPGSVFSATIEGCP
jgi:hypothetical protein